MTETKRRRIAIVFEEQEGANGATAQFRVHMEGDCERLGKTNAQDLGTAERFAAHTYQWIQNFLKDQTCVTSIVRTQENRLVKKALDH